MKRFSSDCSAIRQWLGTRKRSLEQHRLPHEDKWRQIREVFCPNLGHSLKGDIDGNTESAQRDDNQIYNTTPCILHNKLASGLQSGITNQARQWFVFRAKNRDVSQIEAVRSYLGKATDYLHSVIAQSNLYTALDQLYLRLSAFGQSAALLVHDSDTIMRMIVCDEGAYWINEDKRGRVNTLMRRLRYTLNTLAEEFGRDVLPDRILESMKKGELEQAQTVYNLVCPTADLPNKLKLKDIPKDREFVSIYWLNSTEGENNGIIAIRSYDYNPIIAPRWAINGITCYGYGPGEIGLGDAKELQQIELASLRLTELESNPPMAAPTSMKGTPLDTGPGGITYYDPLATGGNLLPVQRLFETRQSIEAIEVKAQAVQQRLNQIFFTDLFAMLLNLELRGQPRTATEVQELAQEKVALLGPILTRLNNDLLKPLVEAAWHIAYQNAREIYELYDEDVSGIMEPPPALLMGAVDEDGNVDALDIEYTSTLHAEQLATSRLQGPFRFVEFYGGVQNILQDPELADNIDGDKLLRSAAEILDSSGYIRDERKVEQIREGRAQAVEAQQQAQMQAQQAQTQAVQAQTVKDLAGTQLTDSETALDLIAGAV